MLNSLDNLTTIIGEQGYDLLETVIRLVESKHPELDEAQVGDIQSHLIELEGLAEEIAAIAQKLADYKLGVEKSLQAAREHAAETPA